VLSQAYQSMLYLPLYVAIDRGFFKKEGLDVIKHTAGSPSTALSAVISGSSISRCTDRNGPLLQRPRAHPSM
jgi:NitT/TauT family transport system substrate-binding protein